SFFSRSSFCVFFLDATSPTNIYTLSLHDALPIFSVKSEGLTINPSNNVGFNLTAYMDAPIAPGLSIQPGISLQNKGMKFDFGGFIEDDWVVDEDIPDKYTLSLMYLEVPVNLVYYLPAGSGDVFLGAGPYLGIGIGGKEKYGSVSEDVVWGDDGFK